MVPRTANVAYEKCSRYPKHKVTGETHPESAAEIQWVQKAHTRAPADSETGLGAQALNNSHPHVTSLQSKRSSILLFFLLPLTTAQPSFNRTKLVHFPTMLLYTDILTGDEMFSDAFPVFVWVSYFPHPRVALDANLWPEIQRTYR